MPERLDKEEEGCYNIDNLFGIQKTATATMKGGAAMDIDMDIKELEAFVYVVENCSFSRAAELLHLTQPTISSHISALER